MKNFYVATDRHEFEAADQELLRDPLIQENSELAAWIQNCSVAEVWDEGNFVLQCVGEVTLH